MSSNHCYLCASDEGLLLDIFGVGGKAIYRKIETCLSVKIEERNALSTKICHKCAYELDACSKFVQKYREARDARENRAYPIKGHCGLCSEPGREGYIFHCKDGNPVNGSLQKIHEIFDDSIFKDKRRNLSICLDCRYNLDVLFDLKCIYKSTPEKLRSLVEKGARLSELPKTTTRVVSRNTTYIPLPRLNGVEVSDTESSTSATSTMPTPRKRGRPRKSAVAFFRTCDKCETNVESGIDMYRYHSRGDTVCRDCWLSMDPEKVTHKRRKKLGLASGDVGTRRCAIILKDVITNPGKYENIYKVEKDEHGNTTFIVTDDSSGNEEKEKTPAKRTRRSHGSVTSVESTPAKKIRPPKRAANTKSTDVDDEPPAKIRGKKITDDKPSTSTTTRTRNGLATSDTEVFVSRTRRKSLVKAVDSEKTVKAASDLELTKPPVSKRVLRTKLEKTEPLSPREIKIPSTVKARKTAKTVAPVVSTPEPAERPVRRTRTNSLSISGRGALTPSKSLSATSRSAKSVSEAGSPPTRTRRSKTKSLSPKNSGSESEKPYTCNVCQVEYKSKLIGMEHELSHAKQPEVKLQRVTVPEIVVEEAPAESLIEEPEEQSHDVSSTSDHRPEDPERVKTSTNAATNDEASILKESKSSPEADEASTKADVEEDKGDKIEDRRIETEDKTHDKKIEEEDKTQDKRIENGDKTQDERIENEDKTQDEKIENEDKSQNEKIENEDKTQNEKIENKDKSQDERIENEDKTPDEKIENEDKSQDEKIENEDKTQDERIENEDKTQDERIENEDKTQNERIENEDKTQDETIENKDKTQEKSIEKEDKNEVQTDDRVDKVEDDENENKADENEDKADDKNYKLEVKPDEDEDKTDEESSKVDEGKANTEDKTDEGRDRTEHRSDEEEDKTEDKINASEATEPETTVEDKELEDNNVENAREDDTKDSPPIAECDANNDDRKTETTPEGVADSEKPESTLNDEVEEKIDTAETREMQSGEESHESAEKSGTMNGVTVKDADSAGNEANEVEKEAVALDSDAQSKNTGVNPEESSEPEKVTSVTSTAPEEELEDKDVEDETTKDLEGEAEAATTEAAITQENNTTKGSKESESIANDVLTEVFDLATAEVQKRLDNERPRDEECTTPVSETLENISREICSSADMPSLEPLVEAQSNKS